jgi:hypothetical protein
MFGADTNQTPEFCAKVWRSLMGRWMGLWLVLAGAHPVDEPGQAVSGGLRTDRAAIDFGTVPRFATRSAQVSLRNDAGRTIKIQGTDSNCSCLASEVEARRLGPGERTAWKVLLETCDYVGEVRRHVWINSDAADRPRFKIPIRYRVVPELFIEPPFAALGLIGEEPIETVIEVKTAGEQTLHLGQATCNDPLVEALIEDPTVTRNKPGRIRLLVHGPVPEGRFRPTVSLETTSFAVPRLNIPLFGESVKGLRSDRREIVFDEIALDSSQTGRITLFCDPGVQVAGIRTADRTVDVQQIKREPEAIAVTLRSHPQLPLGRFQGFLVLEVNNGRSRKIKLPFRGRVIEAGSARLSENPHASSTR